MNEFVKGQVKHIVEDEVKKWQEENTEESIRKHVREQLDAAKRDVIRVILGFRKYGSTWEVDTSNKNNPCLAAIRAAVAEEAAKLIKLSPKTIITKRMKEGAESTFIKELRYEINRLAKHAAGSSARSYASEILKNIDDTVQALL